MSDHASGCAPVRLVDDGRLRVEVGDQAFLVDALCPHRRGRLLYAHLDTRQCRLTCPLHHTTFDLATGEVIAGPSERILCTQPVDAGGRP